MFSKLRRQSVKLEGFTRHLKHSCLTCIRCTLCTSDTAQPLVLQILHQYSQNIHTVLTDDLVPFEDKCSQTVNKGTEKDHDDSSS